MFLKIRLYFILLSICVCSAGHAQPNQGYVEKLLAESKIALTDKNYAAALPLLIEADSIVALNGPDSIRPIIYNNLGIALYGSGELLSAFRYYNKAILWYSSHEMIKECIETKYNLGLQYKKQGMLANSDSLVRESLAYFKSNGTKDKVARAYTTLGNIQKNMGDHSAAIDYHEKAIQIRLEISDSSRLSSNYNSLGHLYLLEGNYEKSAIFLQEALRIKRAFKTQNTLSTLCLLSDVFLKQNMPDSSARYLNEADTMAWVHNNPAALAMLLRYRAEYHLYKNEIEVADSVLQRNWANAQTVEDFEEKLKIVEGAIKIKSKQKQFEELVFWYERKSEIERELRSIEQHRSLIASEARYQTQELRYELSQQKLEYEKIAFERLLWIIGFGSVFLLAIGLFYFMRKDRIRKNELEALNLIISDEKDEVEALHQELHHRVKNQYLAIRDMIALEAESNNNNLQVIEIKEDVDRRINVLSRIHEALSKNQKPSGRLVRIDIFLQQFVEDIPLTFKDGARVKINTSYDAVEMSMEKVQKIGLIVNELITNSCKYAFENTSQPIIDVKLKKDHQMVIIEVADNGIWRKEQTASGVGHQLIHEFSKKLDAEFTVDHSAGTCFSLIIPYKEKGT